jgi:mannitol/fructose-specific phosphotransferase system IIA component (Ntr-type)
MKISRLITPPLIKLEMNSHIELDPNLEISPQRKSLLLKEAIIQELTDLLENSGNVRNSNKLFLDLFNREKKASTGIGHGIAIPHVRTIQVKELAMGFARSSIGYDFDSLDNQPVHLFFVMAAPPYDDALYLKLFKSLAEILQFESVREELLHATSEYEIIRAIRKME